jgi:NAD(P)-dependent dehydrogenase (short-subunit alcohol dehydrogenase family)
MLGEIKTFDKWGYGELIEIMNVNVWSNKYILDWLFEYNIKVKQVISISSGASEHTYKGWGGYSITKSALRMMTEVYSKEIEDTHFISLAPGLVDTSMQDYLCSEVDVKEFPVIEKFIQAKKDRLTEQPNIIAKKIIELVPSLKNYTNGSFLDLRNM